MCGEVGLLSHNILFRGTDNSQWHDKIKACEAGFNTGLLMYIFISYAMFDAGSHDAASGVYQVVRIVMSHDHMWYDFFKIHTYCDVVCLLRKPYTS